MTRTACIILLNWSLLCYLQGVIVDWNKRVLTWLSCWTFYKSRKSLENDLYPFVFSLILYVFWCTLKYQKFIHLTFPFSISRKSFMTSEQGVRIWSFHIGFVNWHFWISMIFFVYCIYIEEDWPDYLPQFFIYQAMPCYTCIPKLIYVDLLFIITQTLYHTLSFARLWLISTIF